MEFWEWQKKAIGSVVWGSANRLLGKSVFGERVGFTRRAGEPVVYAFRDEVLLWVEPCPHPCEMERSHGTVEEWVMSFLKRREANEQRKAMASAAQAVQWAKEHPALWEYLTTEEYPDGSPRERSMLCFFVENGVFKGALQDRDQQQSLWASSDALESLVEALEAKCAAGDASEWRAMGGATKTKKRR